MTYAEKLKDPRWQRKRLEILHRDSFRCRDCGNTKAILHVHHCHYQSANPWETNDELLLTVCESCHEARGVFEARIKEALGKELACVPVEAMRLALENHGEFVFCAWRNDALSWMNRNGKAEERGAFFDRLMAAEEKECPAP